MRSHRDHCLRGGGTRTLPLAPDKGAEAPAHGKTQDTGIELHLNVEHPTGDLVQGLAEHVLEKKLNDDAVETGAPPPTLGPGLS